MMSGPGHAPRNNYRPLPSQPADVRELGHRARAGDEHARARLIEGLMPLALARARRFAGPLVPLDEAEAVAKMAVIRAVDRFDPNRGPLVPYAERWINGALRRTLTENIRRRDAERGTTRAGRNETLFLHSESPEVLHQRGDILGLLPPRERSLVEHLLEGGTLTQWARSQRPPISIARASQLQRAARARLKSVLVGDGPNPAGALRQPIFAQTIRPEVTVKVDLDALLQQQRGRQWNLTISMIPAEPRKSKPRTFAKTGYPSDRA